MSRGTKSNISGVLCLLCAALMLFWIGRMIPYGLAGDVGKAKLYFILMVISFILSLPFGVAYYYYRSNATEDEDLKRMRVEVDALSGVGQKHKDLEQAASGSSRSSEEKVTRSHGSN